jgi:hypothetical protein
LCNQCLSPLKLYVRIPLMAMDSTMVMPVDARMVCDWQFGFFYLYLKCMQNVLRKK